MGDGGGSLSFTQSFVVPRGAVIDGIRTMCTRLGGNAFVDGGPKTISNRRQTAVMCSVMSYANGINNFEIFDFQG